ncbi:hypothetical protein BDZ94DRAFT_1267757 [Collybia nuda]|uniref:Uncharacterized protein n=1 Tax=Collybia nuda TaxID=64659 RepID=A0A9P5XZV7_9AGAR|nr:hypothetical protein BDZ94DRAFT_1267757 [Collybia nuda]
MGVATISLHRASLIALILESLSYGIFTILFVATAWVIVNRRRGNPNHVLLVTLCLIWVQSTAHWIIDVNRAITAFLDAPEGPLQYYQNVSNPLQVAKTAVYVTLTLTGDSFVIYRCYVVWNRTWWIVILPILLWMATGAVGFATTHAFYETKKGGIFLVNLVPLVTSFICMTLSTNVVCTALIAYRILRSQLEIRKFRDHHQSSHVYSAVIILLESAGIYSSSLVALVAVYLLHSNGQFIILDITAQLLGITFSMIILRVALGISSGGRNDTSGQSGLTSDNSSSRMNRRRVARNVSRLVHVDHGIHSISTFEPKSQDIGKATPTEDSDPRDS